MATLQIYCKATSNYPPGLGLQNFEALGQEWTGEKVLLPFREGEETRLLTVVGWTDLFLGRACAVHVRKVRTADGMEGYLVYGGNSGVRVLDADAEPEEWEAHLPPGWGMPLIWMEDRADLPAEVREIVE